MPRTVAAAQPVRRTGWLDFGETGLRLQNTVLPIVHELIEAGPSMSDLALSIVLGVALAAATGFRVFLPMLIASGAAYTGHLHLDDGFAWLGSPQP